MSEVKNDRNMVRKLWTMLKSLPTIFGIEILDRRAEVQSVDLALPSGHIFTNPSLASQPDGTILIAIREVTYRVDARGRYVKLVDPPQSFTWMGKLNAEMLTVSALQRLSQDAPPEWVLEDCRLVQSGDLTKGVWALRDYTTGRYEIEIAVGDIADGRIQEIIKIPSPRGSALEKNWMPFLDEGVINFIYRADTAERYRIEGQDLLAVGRPHDVWESLRGHSGSSQLLRWRKGWLGVTHAHTVLSLPFKLAAWRFYRHHFVYYSDDFKSVSASKPFNFSGRGIEFCAGIVSHNGDIIVAYGSADSSARIARLNESLVAELLHLSDYEN